MALRPIRPTQLLLSMTCISATVDIGFCLTSWTKVAKSYAWVMNHMASRYTTWFSALRFISSRLQDMNIVFERYGTKTSRLMCGRNQCMANHQNPSTFLPHFTAAARVAREARLRFPIHASGSEEAHRFSHEKSVGSACMYSDLTVAPVIWPHGWQ